MVEGIDADRNVALGWPNVAGGASRTVPSPGDVVAGQIARSYLEADGVQGGAPSTVHLAQGRTVEHAIAGLDPHQHAASYVASRSARRPRRSRPATGGEDPLVEEAQRRQVQRDLDAGRPKDPGVSR